MSVKDLSQQQVEEFQAAFMLFDKNGDMKINAKELGNVLRSMGQNPTEKEIAAMIKEVDVNKDGSVNFAEFLEMMARRGKKGEKQEDLRDAFKVFDKDGDGFITAKELRRVMTTMGEQLSDAEVDEMIKMADIDGDGKINYEEYTKMMAS